jgi:hypothetical protein
MQRGHKRALKGEEKCRNAKNTNIVAFFTHRKKVRMNSCDFLNQQRYLLGPFK